MLEVVICVRNGNNTKCHYSCKECLLQSLCNDENSCTSCYPGQFKVSPDSDDTVFKCSNRCDVLAWDYKDGYSYCDSSSTLIITEDFSTGTFLPPSTKIFFQKVSKTLHNDQLPFFVFLLAIFITLLLLITLSIIWKRKKKNQNRNTEFNLNPDIVIAKSHHPDEACKMISNKRKNLRILKSENETLIPYFGLEEISINDFKKNQTLGCGSFSEVVEGTLRGNPVAIKVAVKHNQGDRKSFDSGGNGRKSIYKEMQIYCKVSHPHIVPALGFHCGVEDILFLTLRKCDLRTHFRLQFDNLDFLRLKEYCLQVADALIYLHSNSILHGDLKIDNILVKDDNGDQIEISDFGCAVDLAYNHDLKFMSTETHMAYELHKKLAKPSTSSDVWSFGVTAWQIFQKNEILPVAFWFGNSIIENYEAGKKLPTPATISEKCWHFIFYQCFDLDPESRPTMQYLYNCLKDYKEDKSVPSSVT